MYVINQVKLLQFKQTNIDRLVVMQLPQYKLLRRGHQYCL